MSAYNSLINFMGDLYENNEFVRALLDAEGTIKGKAGEFFTLSEIKKIDGYHKELNNILIPLGNNKTEIDLLVIHEKGLFVFESKNYSGWIFGNEKNKHWTQSFNRDTRYNFFNPVMQNEMHLSALEKLLNIDKNKMYSYIVFSERCELKDVPKDTDRRKIFKRDRLIPVVNNDISSRNECFSKEEIEMLYEVLMAYKPDKSEMKEHKERVRKYSSGYTCPKCGNGLVLRKGQYGRFIGCSGFPSCRFTRPATELDVAHFSKD